MILFNQETVGETIPAMEAVQQNLEQLKPNVVLETMKGWIPDLISFGIRVLIAILILAIGFKITKMIRKMLNRSFERMDIEISLRKFLLSFIDAIIYGLIIFIAADKIGISSASIIAVLGSAGLALGLALQGSLANFAGGVLILMMKPFRVGDYIVSKDGEGSVTAIGLVYTTLNTVDNKRVVIPNGNLANSPLTNVTAKEKRRVDILVGIGYSSDLKRAKEIMHDIYAKHPLVLKEESIDIFVDSLGDSAVMIGGRGWAATDDYWKVKWDITESIKLEFDAAGIEIPFNQIDVHIKQES